MMVGVDDEAAITATPTGGFAIANTLRKIVAALSTGFNLEHDAITNRHSTIRATGSIYERGRTVPQGEWSSIPYGAVAFAGSAAAWTVQAADILTYRYSLLGKTLLLEWYFTNTSVTAGSGYLALPLPPGFTAAPYQQAGTFFYLDNGTSGIGLAQVLASTTTVRLLLYGLGNWAAAANTTDVAGQLRIEIV